MIFSDTGRTTNDDSTNSTCWYRIEAAGSFTWPAWPDVCVCPICGYSHQSWGVRRRWIKACDRARKLARGDEELARAYFALELDQPKLPPVRLYPYYGEARVRRLRTVWSRACAAPVRRCGRMSLRRVYRRAKREARPGWRRARA